MQSIPLSFFAPNVLPQLFDIATDPVAFDPGPMRLHKVVADYKMLYTFKSTMICGTEG